MQVNTAATQSSSSSSSAKSPSSGSSLDYNSFLTLFMAEMKNQDPTAPSSSTEYIAQFATFSQVEQSMQTQRRFVADAAHELRSPMTALSLQAERLAAASSLGQAHERLVPLRLGIDRARHLLEQLLALARAPNDGPPM